MPKSAVRRSKLNQSAPAIEAGQRLSVESLKGIVLPVSTKTENITVRLSGSWLEVWHDMKAELPGLSDSEIIRQALALRAALLARNPDGSKVQADIRYINRQGQACQVDLEDHVGIPPSKEGR